jgi:putative addiction module component (TIGR02574 family)
MHSRTDRLLHEALGLTVSERARLARELLASMDGEADTDTETAWADEIARREERAVGEHSRPVDWSEIREQAVSRLRGRE